MKGNKNNSRSRREREKESVRLGLALPTAALSPAPNGSPGMTVVDQHAEARPILEYLLLPPAPASHRALSTAGV